MKCWESNPALNIRARRLNPTTPMRLMVRSALDGGLEPRSGKSAENRKWWWCVVWCLRVRGAEQGASPARNFTFIWPGGGHGHRRDHGGAAGDPGRGAGAPRRRRGGGGPQGADLEAAAQEGPQEAARGARQEGPQGREARAAVPAAAAGATAGAQGAGAGAGCRRRCPGGRRADAVAAVPQGPAGLDAAQLGAARAAAPAGQAAARHAAGRGAPSRGGCGRGRGAEPAGPRDVGAAAAGHDARRALHHPGQHAVPRHGLARPRGADPGGVRLRAPARHRDAVEVPRAAGGRVRHAARRPRRGPHGPGARVPRRPQARAGRHVAAGARRRGRARRAAPARRHAPRGRDALRGAERQAARLRLRHQGRHGAGRRGRRRQGPGAGPRRGPVALRQVAVPARRPRRPQPPRALRAGGDGAGGRGAAQGLLHPQDAPHRPGHGAGLRGRRRQGRQAVRAVHVRGRRAVPAVRLRPLPQRPPVPAPVPRPPGPGQGPGQGADQGAGQARLVEDRRLLQDGHPPGAGQLAQGQHGLGAVLHGERHGGRGPVPPHQGRGLRLRGGGPGALV